MTTQLPNRPSGLHKPPEIYQILTKNFDNFFYEISGFKNVSFNDFCETMEVFIGINAKLSTAFYNPVLNLTLILIDKSISVDAYPELYRPHEVEKKILHSILCEDMHWALEVGDDSQNVHPVDVMYKIVEWVHGDDK